MSELILISTIHYFCTITVPLARDREIKERNPNKRDDLLLLSFYTLYLQARLHHCCY